MPAGLARRRWGQVGGLVASRSPLLLLPFALMGSPAVMAAVPILALSLVVLLLLDAARRPDRRTAIDRLTGTQVVRRAPAAPKAPEIYAGWAKR